MSLCILVTRPDPAGSALCQRLQAQGDVGMYLPTIAIEPPRDLALFNSTLDKLGEQDWLIFISPQAVYAAVPAIRQRWPQLAPQTQFAGVGAGTAVALTNAGYTCTSLPKQNWGSEGLLELGFFQTIKDKKITIVRGEGGRDLLEKTLAERGAIVSHLIAYRRAIPTIDINPYLVLLKDHKIDAIVCASFQGVQHLKTMIGDGGWSDLARTPLIVVSERIKALASDLGFQRIWVAANASHQAILEIIAQRRTELCQRQQSTQ